MNSKILMKRIAALMLTLVMTLSMSSFAFEDVFAGSEEDGQQVSSEVTDAAVQSEAEADEGSESSAQDAASDKETAASTRRTNAVSPQSLTAPDSNDQGDPNTGESADQGENNGDPGSPDQGDQGSNEDPGTGDEPGTGDDPDPSEPVEPGAIEGLALSRYTAGASGTISAEITWEAYENAASYLVRNESSEGTSVTGTSYTLTGLSKGQTYKATVDAIDADGTVIASGSIDLETYVTDFKVAGSSETSKIEAGQIKYNNKIKITWNEVPGADSYTVTKAVTAPDGSALGTVQKVEKENQQNSIKVSASSAKAAANGEKVLEAEFQNLYPGRKYTFKVTAMSGNTAIMESKDDAVKNVQPRLTRLTGRSRSSRSVSPGKMTFPNGSTDLRAYSGQKRNGWGVAQGGSSDGTNAYVLLANSYKQTGRIAKFNITSGKLGAVSDTLETTHGNGMTYDTRRGRLVVIGRDDEVRGNHKQEITVIDAGSLKIIQQKNLNYSYYSNDDNYFDSSQRGKGLAAISYSAKYDVYIAKQRGNNNLIVIDPDTLKAIGLIKTVVNQYGGAGQAMDGDDQFVYMLKSGYGKSNKNIILTLDWNGNQLIDSNTGYRRTYVPEYWTSLNNGYPVAMYTINTPHEAENVYHYFNSAGQEIFYLTEYDANQQYNITKTKKKYKVKWKKVKKKVKVKKKYKKKVKWKKVKKKNGKYKWKYKKVTRYKYVWKKKKVWKYKKKTKTITVKTPTYKDRKDYVYPLGAL